MRNEHWLLQTKKHLTLQSDNFTGQNKNRIFLFVLIYVVSLSLLRTGHSFLFCDRDFGVIEKHKRVTKAYVSDDLCEIITSAKLSKLFQVVKMGAHNIQEATDKHKEH